MTLKKLQLCFIGVSPDGIVCVVCEGCEPIHYPLEVKYAASEASILAYAKKKTTNLSVNVGFNSIMRFLIGA